MSTTADFRNGLVIEFNNDLYMIIEFQHVKPGKGGAFVRTKLKSLTTGRVVENTFNAGVKVITARVERKKYQYLCREGEDYVFMDLETYDQINVDAKFIENPLLLKDSQEVTIAFHCERDKILSVEFPPFIEMTLAEVEPGVKGNTVNKAMTRAKTETGLEVSVPLFIKEGEKIKIDTRTLEYSERVK